MADIRRDQAELGRHVSAPLPPIVIQAGGQGQRMRAGGQPLPKVLIPVRGVPLVERLLRQIAAEGAREFYIITGHAAELVEAHVASMHDFTAGTTVHFVRETTPRGNVGALSELASLNQPVLFAFGDLFTNLSFRQLREVHLQRKSAITAASHYETHRLQLGQLIVDGDRVLGYREKPEYQFLICSGIMMIEPEVLQLMPQEGAVGMNRLVMLAVEAGLAVTHWIHGAGWIDVNTPELLDAANHADWAAP
jgi:NDP-sugar pyrophosphorylase family protein